MEGSSEGVGGSTERGEGKSQGSKQMSLLDRVDRAQGQESLREMVMT